MTTAEKTTTQQRLDQAQARVAALQAEASGLPEAMQQALWRGDTDTWLQLMAREQMVPREIAAHEGHMRVLRRQALQERYDALIPTLPGLKAAYNEVVRRNRETIERLTAEEEAAYSATYGPEQEARTLEEQMREMDRAARATVKPLGEG